MLTASPHCLRLLAHWALNADCLPWPAPAAALREDGNDGNHHQQFNQGEATAIPRQLNFSTDLFIGFIVSIQKSDK